MTGTVPFSNDGSFMELFQKMQAAQKAAEPAKTGGSPAVDGDSHPPPPPPPGSVDAEEEAKPQTSADAQTDRAGGGFETDCKQPDAPIVVAQRKDATLHRNAVPPSVPEPAP
jgi:hypothetical protein